RSFEPIHGVQSAWHQTSLYLTTSQLIPFKNSQVLAQTAISMLNLYSIALVLFHEITVIKSFTHRVHKHLHIHNWLDQIIARAQAQGGNDIANNACAGYDYDGEIG